MRIALALQIAGLLGFLTLANACDSSVSTIGCNFYVGNQSADCKSFTLNYCSWQVCEYYVHSGNTTKCGHYNTVFNSDWGSCMNQCCSDPNAPQTYETLNACYASNLKILIIVLSVVGGVIFIVAVIIICCCCWEKIQNCCKGMGITLSDCCCKCSDSKEDENMAAQGHSKESNDCKSIGPDEIFKQNEVWNECTLDETNILADMNCVICLTANPSVKLQCGHYYHRICILEWVGKRAACPLCQSAQINEITILCERCLSKQRTGNLQLPGSLTTNPEFCEKCKY